MLAPEFPIGVLHFPLRSFEQYRKKIEVADHNQMWDRSDETRATRTRPTRAGRLEDVLREPAPRRRDRRPRAWPRDGWSRTPTFATTCSPAPGVLEEAEPPPGSRAWPEERRQAALAELSEDGMYVISRYMQTVASKKRKRHQQARELKRLRGG